MPDLRQVLKEFVATANAGGYKTENELLSKFPELSGYDGSVLKEFVATANAGGYKTEDELLSKFPEFSGAPVDTQPVKKKDEAYTTPLWQQPQGQPEPEPRQEQTLPFLESKPSGFSLGSQRVPETSPVFEPVPMRTAEEIQEIINRPEYKEQTYFTGVFGDVLKWMDTPSGVSGMNPFPRLGIGEMIDDFGRAVATGMNTGDIVNTTAPLYIAGKKSSDQEIEAFMSASDVADKLGPSDEMVAFSTQYKESDQDVLGFIDAISSNPGAIPDIMVSSFASMVNETSIKAGLAVSGSMAATYAGIAAAGASPTGLGALAAGAGGAVTGAVASIPYAMGAMGAVLETNLSFGEAVKEKLAEDGLSWTKENIRKVLEQDDFLNTARVKAAARGITIGVIDAYTGRLAGKIGANLLKAPGKSALVKSALASSGIEAVGGSGGEAAARLVTGQEMDVAEIGLEGIGEMPMAVIDVGAAVLNQPVYKVNGEIRTENDVRDLISTATAEELGLIKIDIRNDKKGYNKQIQDKIVTGAIRAEVREVNPNMDDATVDAITALEEEKNKFSGKKTQSAKDKVASISSQIKTLQENAVQKPSTEESVLRAEESQVGLQEVGEGDAKEQAPAQEVVKEEIVSPAIAEIERKRKEELSKDENVELLYPLTLEENPTREQKEQIAKNEQDKKDRQQRRDEINFRYDLELAALEQPTEEVVDEEAQASIDRLLSLDETEAVAEQPILSEESQKVKTQLEDFQNTFDEAYNAVYPRYDTPQAKRSATAKSKKAVKKLQQMIGFDIGAYWELDADQTKKREALYSLRENKDYDSYDEMVAAYQKDVAEGNQSELVTSINTLLGVAPKEMEAVSPATLVVEDVEGTTKALEGKDWTPPSQVDNINTFPLLKGTDVVRYIPESVAQKAWEYWDREFETGQTLQRAKERGGFSVSEMNMFYPNWRAESSKINAKEQTSKSVVPPAPKVSSKIPKAKSVPIPVAIPKPAPAPAPKPVAVVSQPQEDVKIYSYNGKNYEIKRLSVKDVDTGRLLTLGFGEIVKENGKLLTPATPVVAKAKTKAAPKAKVEPVKVAPAIVSKPAPASKPVIVPAPTTIVGPVQLREAHMASVNAVRIDQTLTQRQKDAKVDALKVEYQARKAEMESTAPAAAKPKTESKAKTKAAPKKVEPVKVVSKKDEVAIQQLENDIEYAESEIENAKEEIGNTEYNLKEALAEIEKKRDALENKKMSDAAREEANEDLDLEETNAEENYDDEIKKYNDELKEARKDKKKAERRLAKLTGAPAIEVMEEDGPSLEDLEEVDDIVDEDEDGDEFESIKDLDPKVESVGKRVIDRINKLDAALVKHSKSSLNSGIPIPVARLILKAIKGFIKLGMTVNQAIVRVAADMNLAKKDIIESLKELDAIYLSQSALAKVRAQVNLEVTAALASKRSVNEKRKALSDAIKAMAVTGDIASTKVQTLLNRIGKINLDNPVAVENFLKYVENVFNDAAYDTELAGLRAKVAKAKTNVGTKLGTAEGITPLINRLLSIKPSLIPAQLLDSYREIIEMFGSSDAVLVLGNIDDVTTQIQELLDGIDEYLSVIPELTELISDYGNRVLNEDGSLNYQETLVKMLADKTITEEQYNIMRKYKSLIVSKETKPTKTKEEDAQEKKVLLEALSQTDVDMSAVIGNDEKKMAARLIKLAKSSAANILTNRQLLNLLKVFDNINNGYFPHYANKLYVELEAAHKVGFLTKALLKAKMPKLAKLKVKYFGSDNREAIFDRIKNLPLFNIDEVFGDFKTKEFFNAIFDQLASAQQVYNIEVERIGKRLDAMSDRIAKSYGENHNGFVEAKMKMAIYRIQREFESNPGDERVNPALAYINKTLEAIKEGNTMYSNRDAKLLKEIATEYSKGTGENATIDNEKLFASFTLTEKAALKLFDDINKSLQSLAVFTGDVIRGDQVHLLVDYNHLNVLPGKKQASSSLAEASEKFNPSSVVSTKAGSLIERTAGVKAINFDIFSTVERGANHVLLDYHLTNPVRIARRAISLTRQQIEDSNDGSEATSNQLDMLGAISDAVELALKAMLDSALVKDSVADMIAKDLARTGYRAMLAGIPRASVELASNMSYVAIAARKEYAKGISISRKNKSVVWGEMAANIMKVAGAKTMSRVIGSDSLTGRIVDSSVLSKRTKRSSTILTPVENTILTIHNKSTKKLKNGVEYVADNLISSPDKIMMRPLWFGSFANAFKSITGVEVDFDKMNDADVDYLTEYQDAINSATNVADEKVAMAGNVDNPFMNSLRSFIPSEASALEKTYKVFNNFMNKFMIGEFLVARRGVHAMMGDGSISRKQGAALLAAVVTRMTVYSVMLSLVSQFVYGLFTDDEDEDDQKSFDKKLGQGLASTATSLLLGRTYGNLVRTGINAGVELFNEEYLDGLREGDYDPYKDAIQYTFIQPGTTGKGVDLGDVFTAIAGPYAPAMKTASFALKTLGAADKKEDAAIERADDEKYYRLPLEIFGNLGYVPLYKDIRTIVNKNIYAALDKELKKQEKKKASGGDDKEKESDFKPMGLNRVDLKRYYPEIYEQYYGEGSEAEATRKIEYEKNRLEREIKDERYGYIPKKRSKKREKTRSKVRDTKRRGGR